jgi:hypothetical protein
MASETPFEREIIEEESSIWSMEQTLGENISHFFGT